LPEFTPTTAQNISHNIWHMSWTSLQQMTHTWKLYKNTSILCRIIGTNNRDSDDENGHSIVLKKMIRVAIRAITIY
jgi:hypothetical protein